MLCGRVPRSILIAGHPSLWRSDPPARRDPTGHRFHRWSRRSRSPDRPLHPHSPGHRLAFPISALRHRAGLQHQLTRLPFPPNPLTVSSHGGALSEKCPAMIACVSSRLPSMLYPPTRNYSARKTTLDRQTLSSRELTRLGHRLLHPKAFWC